jgi:hypothetical protein
MGNSQCQVGHLERLETLTVHTPLEQTEDDGLGGRRYGAMTRQTLAGATWRE